MKSFLLKYLAGAALKGALSYALRLVSLLEDALTGVLAGNNLADDTRQTIAAIAKGMATVLTFLQRLAVLLGISPVAPLTGRMDAEELRDEIEHLRRRLEGIAL